MGNIVSLNDVLNSKEENLKVLKKFETNFNKCLNKCLKQIIMERNTKNFEYLYDNYNSVMNLFKSGVIKTEVLKRFLKRLNTVIELCEDELDFIYYVLYFFNYYKIYGDEYIDLSKSDIKSSIILYQLYEREENIFSLNNILDGFFNIELFNKFKTFCKSEKEVAYKYSDAFDDYLYGKENNEGFPFLYYFKDYISYLENEKENDEDNIIFSKGILTPEYVYKEIKDMVYAFASLLYSIAKKEENEDGMKEAFRFVGLLDNMVLKLKSIEEPERTNCLIYIREVWISENKNLEDKVRLTFDKIEKMCNNIETSKKK